MIAVQLFRNPRLLVLLIAVITVAGLSAVSVMPRLEDPILGKRVAFITTVFPGANAEKVESLVTLKIEQRLQGLSEAKQVRSTSRAGISTVVLQLGDEISDFDSVWSHVRNVVNDVGHELPEGCAEPVMEVFPMKAFAAILAMKARTESIDLTVMRRLGRQFGNLVRNLPGTESVEIFGDPGEEFSIEVPPENLVAHRLSIGMLAQQLATNIETTPAGTVNGETPLLLEVETGRDTKFSVGTPNGLSDLPVQLPGGASAKLSDIASISTGMVEPQREFALAGQDRVLVIGALVDDQVRIDHWAEVLRKTMADFEAEYAAEIDFEIISLQDTYVQKRLTSLSQSLLLGGAAVLVIVGLMMGWRSMLVVGVSLPLSTLLVMAGLRGMDIPIHQISVTGVIVALGLLIDNAIIIAHEVRGKIIKGLPAEAAIGESIDHLRWPLFGSTLTTALAFMPIAMLPGAPGEFVGTIAISVILAIGSSFVLAMTVIPAMLATLQPKSRGSFFESGIRIGWLRSIFEFTLLFVFRFPVLGVFFSVVLPIIGYLMLRDLPKQFFPPSDRDQIYIEVEFTAGESIDQTLAAARAINQHVEDHPSVSRAFWFGGRSAPTFYYNVIPNRRGTPHYAQAIVQIAEDVVPRDVVRSLQQKLSDKFAACRIIVRLLEQGPPCDAPIEIRLAGPDLQQLQDLGNRLRLILSETNAVLFTRSDMGENVSRLSLNLDQRAAAESGISQVDFSRFLYATLDGMTVGHIIVGEEHLPVRVRMMQDAPSNSRSTQQDRLEQLAGMTISRPPQPKMQAPASPSSVQEFQSGSDHSIPISAISKFSLTSDVGAITRVDGDRVNEIKAYIQPGVLPSSVLEEFRKRLETSSFRLPNGYNVQFGGEDEQRSQAINNLIANSILLFALMVLSLVASFRSFRATAIIIMVGALAAGLGPFALGKFGFPLGFMSIVGTMGLVGIAINDSIIVLAALRDNAQASSGNIPEVARTVIECSRHVLATTLTTLLGFLPLLLNGGPFWQPLALCISVGVAGATFLALYFAPSVYLLMQPAGWRAQNSERSIDQKLA